MPIILSILFILNIKAGYAQIPTSEQINEVKGRKFLVVLEEVNPDLVKDLEKDNPKYVETYKNAIDIYNSNLKIAVDSFWEIHDEIKYVTVTEAKAIKKTKSKVYTLISSVSVTSGGYQSYNHGWSDSWFNEDLVQYHKITLGGFYGLGVTLIEDYGEKSITIVPSNRILPTKSEMACMIFMLNNAFIRQVEQTSNNLEDNLAIANAKCKDLKELTLLINIYNISTDLTVDEITHMYPFQIEILEDSLIDEIIYSKKPGFVYFYTYPQYLYSSSQTLLTYQTINTNDIDGSGSCFLNPFDFKIKTVFLGEVPCEDNYAKLITKEVMESLILNLK